MDIEVTITVGVKRKQLTRYRRMTNRTNMEIATDGALQQRGNSRFADVECQDRGEVEYVLTRHTRTNLLITGSMYYGAL